MAVNNRLLIDFKAYRNRNHLSAIQGKEGIKFCHLATSAQPAMAALAGPDAAPDVPFIVLGLRTLGTFDFEGNADFLS